MLRSVGVLALDGLAMFEFGVVCEVFGIDRSDEGIEPFDFRVASPDAAPVGSRHGLTLSPPHDLDALADVDLLAVPATVIQRGHDARVLDTIRAAQDRGATVLSVCSGAFVLAEAGILDGRRATTHWMHADQLAREYPAIDVDPTVLFVDDGTVVTSAGTAAGIDACLHVVRRELGSEITNTIARRMVVPPQRDGGQRQFVVQPVPSCTDDSLRATLEWAVDRLDEPHTVTSLARHAVLSPRTFARRFVAETGTTPVQWLTTQRVLRARHLLEQTDVDLESLARTCGFSTAALLRHHFRRAVGVAPADYRTTFRLTAA
ncbi:GlxA family transcriptional regulator [Luteimicrobium subarcticum]|uniref:AraC family transcriptional regulator with amidase-like domain n=1 Tax=Luteimicrobium subarcticum TaxID=620910 RepID=A0A2M8WT01_9MICO|nr:helix-turn-helix domain-containing protein [Luteimicrobium subarcticum]PJI94050.1 AraC family transcriptional regulator with amidase-like domain [Luteimicrobium subarcticum]